MFERFTQSARRAVVAAQGHARRLGHDHVQAEHLLLGVLDESGEASVAALLGLGLDTDALAADLQALGRADEDALRTLGVDLAAIRTRVEAQFGPGALDQRPRRRFGLRRRPDPEAHVPFTGSAKEALEQSLRQALALRHRSIGAEHVLLGLLATDQAPAARALARVGVAPQDARAAILRSVRSAPAA